MRGDLNNDAVFLCILSFSSVPYGRKPAHRRYALAQASAAGLTSHKDMRSPLRLTRSGSVPPAAVPLPLALGLEHI